MHKHKRSILNSHFANVAIIVSAIAGLFAIDALTQIAPALQDSVARGAYLALAGDCIACHTAPKGDPYAGGVPFNLSVGRVYSTNITPDLETGIGHYTADDFVKVMRNGVAKDGHYLYPAMPFPSYTKVSSQDLRELYTFFMQGVKPVQHANQPAKLKGLFGARSYMAIWDALYLKKAGATIDAGKGVSWNRGAYLVQGLGHCGDCHTPRGIAGQVKAGNEQNSRSFLAGATLENWHASSLTGDPETGLHAWSKDEIVEYLKTGRTTRVAASGIMAGVVAKSTQYLTDQDLMAIAEYLKSLSPSNGNWEDNPNSTKPDSTVSAATAALRSGDTGIRGSRVYLDNCNACHQSDGSGAKRTFPSLVKNEAAGAKDPISLIHIVLTGSSMPSTQTAPSALAMPDFGKRLSDGEVADVLTFVRSSWGNHAAAVSNKEVGRVRKALAALKEAQ